MDSLNDLKATWLTAKTDSLPSAGEMLRIVKKHRNETLRKKIVLIAGVTALATMMVVVMFIYKSAMITTRMGEMGMLIGCSILVFTNLRSIKRFVDLQDCSNREFISFLEKTRQNQIYFYQKTQVTAMAFSACGLLLYIYELVSPYAWICLGAYTAILLYIGILWFVVRPRIFKKNAKKLNELIARMEAIAKQIKINDDEKC